MPEYLAPGVYIEETSFRPKSIEGVSTSTAGFVGPARYGPTQGEPELLTSFADFERIYGGLDPLVFQAEGDEVELANYLAHAVRAFFEEGGKRCYVARVYDGEGGRASATLSGGSLDTRAVTVRARHPGRAGEVPVRFTVRIGPNVLANEPPVNNAPATDSQGRPLRTLRGAGEGDVVWVRDLTSPISTPPGAGTLYWVDRYFDDVDRRYRLRLRRDDPADTTPNNPLELWADSFDEARVVTVSVTVGAMGKLSESRTWENLAFHPGHRSGLGRTFEADTQSRRTELFVPLEIGSDLTNGAEIAEILLAQPTLADPSRTVLSTLDDPRAGDAARTFQVLLRGGSDGARPGADEYEGDDGASDGLKSGLRALEDVDDISIVAAPGSTYGFDDVNYRDDVSAILRLLIGHAERMQYRIAVLDSAPGQLVSEVRDYRGQLDSKYAALYYPWIRIFDPISESEILVPPSGSVAGIYARNDIEHGVHKAPANEVVRQALGFEFPLSKGQQDVLNPEGINAFRFFEGRGYRLWGARTISSDAEWKYVNLRRYFIYLEKSIEKGTQFAVFENNGPRLWNNISRTVDGFLFNEFANGRLFGTRAQEAYFVRCDLSTMNQNDLDNGRLVCLIGVAALRPAEFVIFRIGQWTADRRA
jgi:phage tail sheath protein FI